MKFLLHGVIDSHFDIRIRSVQHWKKNWYLFCQYSKLIFTHFHPDPTNLGKCGSGYEGLKKFGSATLHTIYILRVQESTYRVRFESWYELMFLLGKHLKHHALDVVKERLMSSYIMHHNFFEWFLLNKMLLRLLRKKGKYILATCILQKKRMFNVDFKDLLTSFTVNRSSSFSATGPKTTLSL